MQPDAITRLRPAFVELLQPEPGAYHGAVLVTDGWGDPLEFHATDVLRPTPLQQALWGTRLALQWINEGIVLPLLAALETPVDLVLVRAPAALEARLKYDRPLVQVFFEKPGGDDCRPAWPQSDPAAGPTCFLRSHRDFPADLRTAQAVLAPTAPHLRLHEPFARIGQALKLPLPNDPPSPAAEVRP